jgi:hypothetical protein
MAEQFQGRLEPPGRNAHIMHGVGIVLQNAPLEGEHFFKSRRQDVPETNIQRLVWIETWYTPSTCHDGQPRGRLVERLVLKYTPQFLEKQSPERPANPLFSTGFAKITVYSQSLDTRKI